MPVSEPIAVPTAVVLVASLVAAVTDVTRFRIHNVLTIPLLVTGVVYHGVTEGPPGVIGSLLGMLLGFGVLIVFFIMGGVGAGDVKFLAAVGAWLGLAWTFNVFIASSLAAGIYALGLIIVNRSGRDVWVRLQILWHRLCTVGRHLGSDEDRVEVEVSREDRRRRVIPFAAMIAIGVLGLVIYSWLGTR